MQKATLDPSKISGRCGRLMCCLRFEDEAYQELKKRLPHIYPTETELKTTTKAWFFADDLWDWFLKNESKLKWSEKYKVYYFNEKELEVYKAALSGFRTKVNEIFQTLATSEDKQVRIAACMALDRIFGFTVETTPAINLESSKLYSDQLQSWWNEKNDKLLWDSVMQAYLAR